MKEILIAVRRFLHDRFNLDEDKADEQEIVAGITRDVNFKGTNLWTLIFAIMIASIGLNVNSTAVIIGAMLISPLMGPIMGIGLGVGTNDIDLLKKGIKNLGIAAIISIITSTIYFSITPLHSVNSELLARTNPSLWDVFIAFFGGLAGIVAGTDDKKAMSFRALLSLRHLCLHYVQRGLDWQLANGITCLALCIFFLSTVCLFAWPHFSL